MKKLKRVETEQEKLLNRSLGVRCKYDEFSREIRFEIKFKYIPRLINDLTQAYNRNIGSHLNELNLFYNEFLKTELDKQKKDIVE